VVLVCSASLLVSTTTGNTLVGQPRVVCNKDLLGRQFFDCFLIWNLYIAGINNSFYFVYTTFWIDLSIMVVAKKNAVMDPYKVLNLSHSATGIEIKKSYRELARQFHPDRLMSASEKEKEHANVNFARISEAYSMLMDPQRKAQYDHVYKYGGYDDDDEEDDVNDNKHPSYRQQDHAKEYTTKQENQHSKKRKQVGIGYQCTDPFAYLWTSGKVHSTTNVAGIKIPSRYQMAAPGAGVSLSFSRGECRYATDGTRQFKSKTTQFSQGKKNTRVETTTIHKDGRKETIIQGENFVERYTSLVQPLDESLPWYLSAWSVVQDNLSKCYRPCNAVKMQ